MAVPDQSKVDPALRDTETFTAEARAILGGRVDEATFSKIIRAAEDFADGQTA